MAAIRISFGPAHLLPAGANATCHDVISELQPMPDRRSFIAQALASGAAVAMGAAPATAQSFVFPEAMMPRLFRLSEPLPEGTIHVFPNDFGLYWSLPGGEGQVIRYSVGIGRAGLYESGEFTVGAKKKWPSWRPTDEMIERDPASYAQFAEGVPGGPENPLGARALYLFQPGRGDTFLRIHGTQYPRTIGRRVSNGCVRLVNSHITHLYDQVPQGTPVYLL